MTYPIPANEAERLNELGRIRFSEWRVSAALQNLCELAADIVGTPVSLVSLLGENEQVFAARHGIAISGTSRDVAFCAHTIMDSAPLLVEDATQDPRFADNSLVTGEPGIRAYAGVPIETSPGLRVGTICAIDYKPRRFSRSQVAKLKRIGLIGAAILNGHRTTMELGDELKARRQRERELWTAAHRDPLTGLANLKQFRETASRVLAQEAPDNACAVVIVDLDHFKLINDQWGHAEGDNYLRLVAKRMRASVRQCDIVSRIGGDEFAIILPRLSDRDRVTEIVERLRGNLKEIAFETGKPNLGRASIGIAVCPDHGNSLEELYRAADLALYESKALGRNTYRFYNPDTVTSANQIAACRQELQRAVEAREFIPYYQPIVDLRTGRAIGFEALARWRMWDGRIVPPADFQLALTDHEIAPELTRAMSAAIARDLDTWRQAGLRVGRIAINLSTADLLDRHFTKRFLAFFSTHNISPKNISVEVTETVMLGHRGGPIHTCLAELRAAGVTISLDDFGTGYAALQHLRDWPIDRLKIDKGFVRGCLQNKSDRVIISAVVQLANALGIGVTAEGIETMDQLRLLSDINCNVGQGFLLARPMAAEDVAGYIQKSLDPVRH
jgi:diguanylate cyclase (GGDEF)-like protein